MENSKPKVQSRKFRVGNLELEVFLVLFILALLPRALNLDTFITWDEPAWTYRSIKFLTALRRMDFGGTFLVGHPGVMTMWAGATGISIQRLLGFSSAADFAWLSSLPTLDPRNTEALRKLAPFLPAAKLPMAVLNAACVVGIYLLTRRLFGAKTSLLAALFLAFDPFHLALSRVLHIDALAADFMILSVLSLLVHLTERRSPELVRGIPPTAPVFRQEAPNKLGSPNRPCLVTTQAVIASEAKQSPGRELEIASAQKPCLAMTRAEQLPCLYLLLSGAFAALAVLSKSYALFLAPFSALLLAAAYLVKERNLRQAILLLLRSFVIWCLAATLVFFLLWPAMWVDPLGTVQGMLGTAFGFAATPGRTSDFFLGKAVADPGLWFYPVALAFRTTPLVLLGLAVALPLLFAGRKAQKGNLVAILAYACLFTILMNLGAKKFDRYMLPVILALDIVAAWGLVELARLEVGSWKLVIGHWSLVIGHWFTILSLLQAGHILSYHPYYLAYYNPLLGGLSRAVQVLPVGWGEGMDLAARYFNQKEDAPDLRVATGGIPGFASLFKGQTEGLTEHSLATADYAVLYVSDRQQNWPAATALYGQQQPEHVVKIHGVDYAWIYPNTHHRELIAYLESQAEPDDIVLLDAASPFVKYYREPLVYYVISDNQSWSEMTQRLTQSARPQRLWYVAYPGSDMGNWISYQLNTHALLLDQEALLHATVTHYLLTSPVALESSPIEVESNVNFGNRLRLAGYSFAEDAVEYRKQLGVTLHWRAQRGMEENYAFSLRLVDSKGHFWAQVDKWLLNPPGLPTSAWETSEISEGHYLLPIPAGIPPGRYLVRVTVYRTDTLEGVAILDEEGKPAGMEYTLGTISITSPTIPPTTEELAIPHVLSCDFDDQVELLGYGLSADEVRSGDTLGLTLFWRALRLMERDYGLLLELRDEAGRAWMEARFPLPNESYPTSRWRPDEILCPSYDLLIEATVPTGRYRLLVNLLDSDGRRLVEEGFVITELGIEGREHLFTVPEVRFPMWADIAHRVAFLGYDLDRTVVEPGSVLHLTLYWQALATMDTSYTVFTHLLDAEGHVRGQKDSIPCDGVCPTTSWLEGEIITDEYEIAVDPNAPAGEYQIEVGMYDPKNVSRLPAFDKMGGRLPDDRILLGSTIIVENGTK